MKIKLHNSMSKIDKGIGFRFLFDEKVLLSFRNNYLILCYRMDDRHYFLRFDPDTKEFGEVSGFGRNDRYSNPDWWEKVKWEEMSE